MVKTFVLLLWLLTSSGKQQLLSAQHVDGEEVCQSTAKILVEKYSAKGEQVRYLCQQVIEEVGDVDENGNPLPPEKAAASR